MRLIHHWHLLSLLSVSEGYLALRQSVTKCRHYEEIFSLSHVHGGSVMTRRLVHSQASTESLPKTLDGLSVAIVGAGPAGLVLAHQLVQAGAAALHVFEQRPRYDSSSTADSSRVYALGVGMRGRTALKRAKLWDGVVRPIGYESDRFVLHTPIAGIQLTLRDDTSSEEPSLLVYQSDLCRILADALEKEHSPVVELHYDCAVNHVDLLSNSISTANAEQKQSFDLIVGCDGVNSIVRRSMQETYAPIFQSEQTLLPGVFKVARLPKMPPKLDPTAVQLLLPKSGSSTAFCEPVENGACCLLIAGSNETDVLLRNQDDPNDVDTIECIQKALAGRFPKLEGASLDVAAQQLAAAKQGKASKVTCNIYHGKTACLVGDAAHATGGVSGQGLNSALTDTTVLMDSLCAHYDKDDKMASLEAALLQYSQVAVPEGKALCDLSFDGRGNIFTLARDFLFQGRLGIGQPLLQTQLTASRTPFATIRRDRQDYFEANFPSPEEWKVQIANLASSLTQG